MSIRPASFRTACCLAVMSSAVALTAQEQIRHVLSFRPSVHAPGFANGDLGAFSYTIGVSGFSYTWNHSFGMCGGMSLAAADAYYTGTFRSRLEDAPQQGSAAWNTLWARQTDSLLPGVWAKILEWQQRPDVGHTFNLLHSMKAEVPDEWNATRAKLDHGELVPLVLIAGRDLDNPSDNHIVLAYGYLLQPQQGKVSIYVYDSNRPNDDRTTIEFYTTHTTLEMVEVGNGTVRPWRGFFKNDYDRTPRRFVPGTGYGNTDDGRAEWVGDFDGDGDEDLIRYDGDQRRMLVSRLQASRWFNVDAGSTAQFGAIWDGRPFFVGDFANANGQSDGKADIAFYHPGDGNLWMGRSTGRVFDWTLANSSLGQFGALWPDKRMWARDVDGDGATDFVFYYPAGGHWWFGKYDGTSVQWYGVSTTSGFGNLADGRPLWVEDFDGDGDCDVLFYYGPDHLWWLGRNVGTSLTWAPVANTSGYGRLDDGRYIFVADLDGDGAKEVVFYYGPGGNWHMGEMAGNSMQWSGIGHVGFGTMNDGRRFSVADFDGDNRDEIAFYNIADQHVWTAHLVGGALQWGLSATMSFAHPNEDLRLIDLDGDHRTDLARRDPSLNWYRSRSNNTVPQFGSWSQCADAAPVAPSTVMVGVVPNVAPAELYISAEHAYTTTKVWFSHPGQSPFASTTLQADTDPTTPYFRTSSLLPQRIYVHPPQGLQPGAYEVSFENVGGISAPVPVTLVRPVVPMLETRQSVSAGTPSSAIASVGPLTGGYVAKPVMSMSGVPSVLPGMLSLEIGNGFTNMILLPSQLVDAVTGAVTVPVPGMASTLGLPLWLEIVFIPTDGQPLYPLPTSNRSALFVN